MGNVYNSDRLTGIYDTVGDFSRGNFSKSTIIANANQNNLVYFDVLNSLKQIGIGEEDVVGISSILVKMDPDIVESLFEQDSETLNDMKSICLIDPDTIEAIYGISSEEANMLIVSGIFEKEMDPEWKRELLSSLRNIYARSDNTRDGNGSKYH